MPNPLGCYIHIPWCPTRCIYCDFNTYVSEDKSLRTAYHAALKREIVESAAALNHPQLDTLFFGGGTPTTLAPDALVDLVRTVKANFQLEQSAEITTEANPGTLSLDYLQAVREGGINRLSLGVQSFNHQELTLLSRLHDVEAVYRTVDDARSAGFDNLSLDLIFNLPSQTLNQWAYNVAEAIKLQPDHLSIYSLIVEPGTPLHRQVAQGQTPLPEDDLAADMYRLTMNRLAEAGYVQYEISNWAKADPPIQTVRNPSDSRRLSLSPSVEPVETDVTPADDSWQTPALASAHNLIYWRNQPYLGFGAGAYGTVQQRRWANVKRPQAYIKQVEQGRGLGLARDEKTMEPIDPPTAMIEQLLLGLRLVREGVSQPQFEARFGVSLTDLYAEAIDDGLNHNLLEWIQTPTGSRLRLTERGRFFANQVILKFMG